MNRPTKLIAPAIVTLLALIVFANRGSAGKAVTVDELPTDFLIWQNTPETKSNFTTELVVETKEVPFKMEFVDNQEKEIDNETIIKKGVPGVKKETYSLTYWQEKLISKTLKKTDVEEPQNEVVERGTRMIWRETLIEGSVIKYWKKLNVWATSYDSNCRGCRGLTYSGTAVALGTCAVDPKVISLGSKFYVPGYGLCRAEDIGGAIKGKKIDLGFPSIKEGWWSARYVDVYLLDGEPKKTS